MLSIVLLAAALFVGSVPVFQGTPPNGWTLLGIILLGLALLVGWVTRRSQQ